VLNRLRAIRTVSSSSPGFLTMPPRKPKPPKPPTPPARKSWDAPFALKGDSSEDDLFKAVGRALTDWEFVEEALARVYAALMRCDLNSPTPAVRAYGAIIGSKARIDMILAAGEAYLSLPYTGTLVFPSQAKDGFAPLLMESARWSDRRNDVAHGRAWQGGEHFLLPSLYATKKWKFSQPPAYRYSSTELRTLSAAFQDLYDRLSELAEHFERWNAVWPRPRS
jgi:hypothetical protein